MRKLLKCKECNEYGLTKTCKCGGKKVNAHPARFSVEDKYGKYRRQAKKQDLANK